MKQTTTAHLFMENGFDYEASDYEKKWRPVLWPRKVDDEEDRIFVKTLSIEIDVPEFDPTARQIAALEQERERTTAAYMQTLHSINERLSKLQAIGNEVPA